MMRSILFLIVNILLFEGAVAQSLSGDLKRHVSILSSDSIAGRGLGSWGKEVARDYIVQQFDEIGLQSFGKSYLQPFDFRYGLSRMSAANIVAYVPAADSLFKDEWVVLGAHYDHLGYDVEDEDTIIYNGADDNASGVASLIELARYFAEHSDLCKRNILFVAFDAEEIGLRGSQYFTEHLPVGVSNVKAMFSIDMVGMYEKNKGLYLRGLQAINGVELFALPLADSSGVTLKSTGFKTVQNTDTAPFGGLGIPSVHVFTGLMSPYHQPEDDADLLDYSGMVLVNNYMRQFVATLVSQTEIVADERFLASMQSEDESFWSNVSFGVMSLVGEGHHVYSNQFYKAKSVLNFGMGIYSHVLLSDHLTLDCQMLYDYNGSKHVGGVFRRHSLTMPVNIQFGTSSDSPERLFCFAGAYYRYHISGSLGGDKLYFNGDNASDEWGVNVGVGFEYDRITAGWTYRHSISNVSKVDNINLTDVNNLLFVGWRF